MQTKKLLLGMAAVICLCLSSCGKDDDSKVALTEIKIVPITLSVAEGKTVTATASPVPADVEGVSFTWTSENSAIAMVAGNGATVTITGVAAGTTNIIVTSGNISAKLSVTVTAVLTLTGFTIEPSAVSISEGEHSQTVTATPVPANASNVNYNWTSADPDVAIVTGDGASINIFGKAEGKTTVTLTSGNVSASVAVTVTPDPTLKSITVTPAASQTLYIGGTVALTAAPVPSYSEEAASTFKWTSSDATTVSVSPATGATTTITALKVGTAFVTVSNASGTVKTDVQVTVREKAQLAGQWLFDDAANLAKATVGNDLQFVGSGISSVAGITASDGAALVYADSYIMAVHGIAANGGGTKVNEYTIMLDFNVPVLGSFNALYQTNWSNPTQTDAELFINASGGIGIDQMYHGSVVANKWHRLVVSVKIGARNYYLDGALLSSRTGDAKDSRYALSTDGVAFFADDDGERLSIKVSAISIWDSALSAQEITSLGSVGN